MVQLIGGPAPDAEPEEDGALAVFTGGAGLTSALTGALTVRGLPEITVAPMPLIQG